MSGKKFYKAALLGMVFWGAHLFSGERTIPVDIFLMVDKSLSMAEEGKFENLHIWVRDHLVTQMLIPGDRISIWEFYGRAEKVLDMVIPPDGATDSIVAAVDRIVPDGEYTDIGLAIDTIREAIAGWGDPERLKILFMLTDLRQEAPWSSRYAGVEERYESPYLAEARIITHGNWYEITLDMDIQDQVVAETKKLYLSIVNSSSEPREESFEGASDSAQFTLSADTAQNYDADSSDSRKSATQEGSAPDSGTTGIALTQSSGNGSQGAAVEAESSAGGRGIQGPLPLIAAGMIVCLAAAGLAFTVLRAHSRKKRKEESETPRE